MNRSVIVFLLGLSLLFNVFFIIGAMTWRVDATTMEDGEIQEVTDTLDLDNRQTNAFKSMRHEFRTESAVLRQQIRRIRAMIAEELASENPDTIKLRMLAEEENDLQAERHQLGTNQFTDFIGLLSPDQRKRLGHRLMGPPGHGHPPEELERRAMERFDLDGDGLLNEEERFAAREFARKMQRERKAQRREMERLFDFDGDGKLSPEEQEALREHMLENRPQRGGDRRGHGNRPHPPDRSDPHPPPHGHPPHGPPPGF